MKETVRCI